MKYIYLIDDDEIVNFINKKVISVFFENPIITIYKDSQEAFLTLVSIPNQEKVSFPDYIFIDINMPMLGGWELLDSLAEKSINELMTSQIFLLSSLIVPEDKERASAHKIKPILVEKPLTIEKLKTLFQF